MISLFSNHRPPNLEYLTYDHSTHLSSTWKSTITRPFGTNNGHNIYSTPAAFIQKVSKVRPDWIHLTHICTVNSFEDFYILYPEILL